MGVIPDDERLIDVSLGGEGYDIVAAAQLGEGVTLGVSLQLHTTLASLHVHCTCTMHTGSS
jgi:hypothetical protein